GIFRFRLQLIFRRPIIPTSPLWCKTLSLHDALPIYAQVEGNAGSHDVRAVQCDAPPIARIVSTGHLPQAGDSRSHGEIMPNGTRSEEHTSELQSRENLVCRLLLEQKNTFGERILFVI